MISVFDREEDIVGKVENHGNQHFLLSYDREDNIAGKGENAGYQQHYLLFP